MGDLSPECVSCEWIDGATGPTVGARFRGRNTTVTESFEMVRTIPLYIRLYDRWVMGVEDRKADPEANMGTLSNLRA
jgi:hypothetical protein